MVENNNNKHNSKDKPSFFHRIHKFASSATVFALLLPSMSSIGLVQAAETEAEDPPIEDVAPQSDPETDVVDSEPEAEVEDTNIDTEAPLPDTVPEENKSTTPPSPEKITNGNSTDLNNPDLFPNLTTPDQSSVKVLDEVPITETNTVTIDPNGGTISPEYEKVEVKEGENYTLEYASETELFKKGHSLTGYTVEGTLLDAEGNEVTEITEFKADYTPLSDVTLTANWKVTTGKFTLVLYDESAEADKYNVNFTNIEEGTSEEIPLNYVNPGERVQWIRKDMPYGHYKLSIDGFNIKKANIRGWNMDKEAVIHEDGTATVYLEYAEGYPSNHATLDIEVEPIPETNTVTIDPNGGTINEDYMTIEVFEGDTYSLPSLFNSGLNLPGYTLVGFEVEGTLLDNEGNPVTEIPTYTTRNYTPESDITLTAIWEVTAGKFIIQLYDNEPSTQKERYTVSLIAEDGTEYDLTSNQYGPGHRTWKVEEVPNGTYTLVVNGFIISEGEKFGQPDTSSDFILNNDGTATIELGFVDNKSTTFIRYKIYGEPIPEVATYPLGVEVRDLENKRTDKVDIVVTNEDSEVFSGSYNDYLQWFTDEELPEGLYTITLTTPEGTIAEINDTVASQRAIATDEENIFTIEVNKENQGSLSAVFAAFRLVEIPPVEVATYQLGVEVRGLDNKRTDNVGVVVTNQEGEVFNGSYNQYKQWLTNEELPEGLYTITLTTPEGTIAKINDTTNQHAVATDKENVFTILLNDENLGYGSSIYGAFRLVKVDKDSEEPTDPEGPTVPGKPTEPTEPSAPEKPGDSGTPDDKKEDNSGKLPKTGMVIPSIGLGFASILGGLGLLTMNKKRKDEEK